ncbi:MAG: hypothetical protein [Circular genetic element sp.]|nr:MAG: hypothetical protein [Circular genetic element sp.]
MVKFTKRDLGIIAGLAGAADFLAEGRFSAPVAKALKTVIRRGGPTAARFTGASALRVAGTAATVGRTIAMRHPVLTTGAVIYYTYKNREELGDLVEQGYEIIQPKAQQFGGIVQEGFETLMTQGPKPIGVPFFPPKAKRKTRTSFNKAVSKGMSIVKGSTSYGKKGTINNAKKAFAAVTKVASAASKKKKAPKKGITRKIYLGVKGLFK